jgi:hypothetical protein
MTRKLADKGLSGGRKMSLKNSKFLPKTEWKELVLSEDILKDALNHAPRLYQILKSNEYIDKVVVGECVGGQYSLTVQIRKEGG